ncbi:hypothetical protein [Clostridium sp. E02]|uniref:hypothetical protein n=1 Tax=Clostridium sp. E02 TaxID=2487134 RepID=UPI000F52A966|nr:hypothetical protein [Clostridium sp. E02]
MHEIIYAVYDNGKLLGEHTSKEWEDLLSVPRQAVRDYAREGRTYGKRYKFKIAGKSVNKETDQKDLGITIRELQEFKKYVKVGDKFTYVSYRKDFVRGVQVESEKMKVVRKFKHIVQVTSLKDPNRTETMNYADLYMQKKRRKKKLTTGR